MLGFTACISSGCYISNDTRRVYIGNYQRNFNFRRHQWRIYSETADEIRDGISKNSNFSLSGTVSELDVEGASNTTTRIFIQKAGATIDGAGINAETGTLQISSPSGYPKNFTTDTDYVFTVKNSNNENTVFNVNTLRLQNQGFDYTSQSNPDMGTQDLIMNVESDLTVNVASSFVMSTEATTLSYTFPGTVSLNVKSGATMSLVDTKTGGGATFTLNGTTANSEYYGKENFTAPTITVEKGATFDMGLAATIGGTSKSYIKIQEGTLKVNNTMTFNSGGTLQFDKSASSEVITDGNTSSVIFGTSGKIDMKSDSDFIVSAGAKVSLDDNVITLGGNTIINGVLEINKVASSNDNRFNLGNFSGTGTVNLTGGAVVKVSSFSGTLSGTGHITLTGSEKLTLQKDSKITSNLGIRLQYGGGIDLYGAEISRITAALGSGSVMNVYDSSVISDLYISGTETSIYIFDQDALLEITKLQGNGNLKIYNFEREVTKVKVGENLLTGNAVIELYDYMDEFLGNAVIGEDNILTFVPEPAEWAAIFGAIALAFVFFKRRK